MIVVIVGGIGEGKSLAAVKELVDRANPAYTNFDVKAAHTRLEWSHLFSGDGKDVKLNFSYWKERQHEPFDIYLDEFHNVMGSRRSISKRNVLLSDWLSQMRKVLGASETNNLYLVTQKLRRIDVNSRELAQWCWLCTKQTFNDVLIPTEVWDGDALAVKQLPLTVIYKHHFQDADALQAFESYGVARARLYMTRFVANWYYKYYDSYELLDFGAENYV